MPVTRARKQQSGGGRLFGLALAGLAAALPTAALAQIQEIPQVVSPLRVESDHNGVNLVSGKATLDPPVLSVPGAPNLRFDRVQNAAPYVVGRVQGQAGEPPTGNWTVHTGSGAAESFGCMDWVDCDSVTGTGSYFRGPAGSNGANGTFRQAGTGAVWHFTYVSAFGPGPVRQSYASNVTYPSGESIYYSYQSATTQMGQIVYRPVTLTSSLGFFISLTYQSDDFNSFYWGTVATAAIYNSASPSTPLRRLTYSGATITDSGDTIADTSDDRVMTCTGCVGGLGYNIEVTAGSAQLPGEGSPALQVTQHPTNPVVQSVTRDGIQWTYSYVNLRYAPGSMTQLYNSMTVTGPNGFNQLYNFVAVGPGPNQRNVMTSSRDSINRTTSYIFDGNYRPTQVTYPEGNRVNVVYDDDGNITSRTTTPKPGSPGLSPITETATYPSATCVRGGGLHVLCWRPTSSRDGMNRQTDYAYNNNGQLTEQLDPADANGVRRRTSTLYASPGGYSRRIEARVCADTGVTCPSNAPIRTEYQYWGNTNLVTLERRWDGGTYLDTTTTYDAGGRVTVADGPLAGQDDAVYYRYDAHGRRQWEIGARGGNGVRAATRTTFRNSDDKPVSVETGTVADPNNPVLTPVSRVDTTYDSRRNPIREATSAAGTTYVVTDRSYYDNGLTWCTAVRMNPAAFNQMPGACSFTTYDPARGPDRIAVNVHDAAGQLLQEWRAYGVTTANGFPRNDQQLYASYIYTPNGKRTYQTDANNNTSAFQYDGHDRLWVMYFPNANGGAVNWSDYEVYGYDNAGNRTSLRKRDGSTITYQYDNLNRLIAKYVPERAGLSSTHTRDVHYGYDLRNLRLYARFDSASGEGVTNSYDGFGRPLSSTLNIDGVSRTLSYQHDAAGNRTRITWPDGAPFDTSYDAAGRPAWLTDPAGSAVAQFIYDSNGFPSALGRPGASTGTNYSPIGRLLSVSHYLAAGLDVQWTFEHNPASQITSRTRSNDAYASNTAYNVNRGYSVNGLNQYTAAGGATFSYDLNGNLISDGSTTYTYDVENRLVATSAGAGLRYDPLGRLYQVGNASGTTRFLYDGDALVAEYNTSGTLLHRYVHGPAAGSDDPLIWYQGGGTQTSDRRNLLVDHQGSVVAVSDNAGNRLFVNGYDPWGIPNATNQGRFQYTGQAWLAELGMYHYKARIYSPTLGRFLQTDPVGYDDQLNLYAYVWNDPVNRVDPSGEDTVVCNIHVNGNAFSGSCRVTRDNSSRTNVTYNIHRAGTDGYGRPEVRTSTVRNSFEGSLTRESLASRLVLGVRQEIMAGINRTISNLVGQPVNAFGGSRSAQASHTPLPPASSPIWRSFQPYRPNIRTDGERYYTYDRRHGEIEVFDRRGNHLGTRNAVSGAWEKGPVAGRRLDL